MFARVTVLLVLAAAIPAWSQVEPDATGGTAPTLDDTQMMTPPPVSGMPYPNFTGTETRSNYLDASLNLNAAYNDNVVPTIAAIGLSLALPSVNPHRDKKSRWNIVRVSRSISTRACSTQWTKARPSSFRIA